MTKRALEADQELASTGGGGEQAKRAKGVAAACVIKNDYPALYRAAVAQGAAARLEILSQAALEENRYRELFAQERETADEIRDPRLMMVSVHDHMDIFHAIEPSELERASPRLFALDDDRRIAPGAPVVASRADFVRNFELFTEGQLRFLDWNNVFCAGGSGLACLQPIPEPHNANNRARRNYFHNVAYKNSDVDLFLYGLPDEAAANRYDNDNHSRLG